MRSEEHVRPRPLSKTIIQETQRSEMETGGNMRDRGGGSGECDNGESGVLTHEMVV